MKQPFATAPTLETVNLELVTRGELLKHEKCMFDSISHRAYELFQNRGCVPGHDREDWFRAESELLKPVKVHVVESDDHLIAHAEVPGFSPHELKVSLESRWLRIGGRADASENRSTGEAIMYSLEHSLLPAEQIFHVAELPVEIDPSKAKVTFKDGVLEIVMTKASLTKNAPAQTNPRSRVDGYPSDATPTVADVAAKDTSNKGRAVSSVR
jgi:HSP20 family protein